MKPILNEIASWKIDASHKANERYFLKHIAAEKVETGEATLVIGRKGTGKTAIGLYLTDNARFNKFAAYLDFREIRAAIADLGITTCIDGVNPWISVWDAILGHQVVSLMYQNEGLSIEAKSAIHEFLSNSPLHNSLIERLKPTKVSTNIKLPYIELSRKYEGDSCHDGRLWAPISRECRKIIKNYGHNTTYFVIVDSIGDDVQIVSSEYEQVVTGLIKAAIQLRSFSSDNNMAIYPCILLRDDIYSHLIDPDASKWNDYAVSLTWGEHSLRVMLSHRIQRANNKLSKTNPSFDVSWAFISSIRHIADRGKMIDIFTWIWRRTHSRPRDFVRFLRIAATYASTSNSQSISKDNLERALKKYSEEFRDEIVHEMTAHLPDAREVMQLLIQINKNVISYADFAGIYLHKFENHRNIKTPLQVLQTLFRYNVIGCVSRSRNIAIYYYRNAGSEFIEGSSLEIHPGLCKGLMLY